MHGEGSHRRADIDGLRAVAVLSVLAFHAFPTLLTGGFVGVDVFFVISGFLISGIIFAEITAGDFSLRRFYARRVRRILPALLLVLLATAVTGFIVLYADEWKELGRQVLAGCLFYSNFLFWREAGYFDVASGSKPLLHLWSLGIEEQFYLFWPALLWLFRGRRSWGILLGITLMVSVCSSLSLRTADPDASFYSPLARFWELGLGALYAWVQAEKPLRLTPRERNFASVLGMFMVIAGVWYIDASMAFPGTLALLPTLGTVCLIAAGPDAVVNRSLLSHPLSTAIGAISYPLYLWHWPLLSFALIIRADEPSVPLRLVLLGVAAALATATYLALERPVRFLVPLTAVARACLGGVLCLCVAVWFGTRPSIVQARTIHLRGEGSANWERNQQLLGWFSYDPQCVAALDLRAEAAVAKSALFCSVSPGSGPITTVLFGDSMANALFPGLAKMYAAAGGRLLNVGNGTCAPFHGLQGQFDWNRPCADVNRKVYDYIFAHAEIHTVILGLAPWDIKNMRIAGLDADASLNARFAALAPQVAADIAALRGAGKHVVVTFDTPRIQFDPRICLREPSRCNAVSSRIEGGLEPYRSEWRKMFAAIPGVCEFQQDAGFRRADGDYFAARDGLLLFRDDHHLSYLGSDLVAARFRASTCY